MKHRIKLDISPKIEPLVKRVLQFIECTKGIEFEICTEEPDLIYSVDNNQNSRGKLICNPSYFEDGGTYKYHMDKDMHLWAPREQPERTDYIGTIYRFLFFIEEKFVTQPFHKDFTSFLSSSLSKEHQRVKKIPIADYNALYVLKASLFQKKMQTPIWSGRGKLTVCLTHDVDGPSIGNYREIIKSFAKFLLRRKYAYWWQFTNGIRSWLKRDSGPLWRFSEWLEKEKTYGARSSFYFYCGQNNYPRHFNDPAYCINSNKKWNIISELEESGAEIGLHSGILAKKSANNFQSDKKFLEKFGVSVKGVRHHYWELNWKNPYETLNMHAQAGLIYDTSIAWKDSVGFRAGTCAPHFSMGLEGFSHVSIPTALLDGHFFEYRKFDSDDCMQEVKEIITHICNVDGVLVLDWHERTFENTPMYKGFANFYWSILAYIDSNFEVNWALPYEVAEKVLISKTTQSFDERYSERPIKSE